MSRFTKVVSRVLRIAEKKVRDDTSPLSVSSWDSFRGLLLITEIEKEYRFKLSMDEVLSIRDVGDIKNVIRKRGLDPDK
jgi:acyl carrier protein